jgi:O-antigen ligase
MAAVFATRQSLGLGRIFRRPAVLIVAVAMVFATVYVTFNKQAMEAEEVTREQSLSKYMWWKLVEDRGLIWSQAIDAFASRPLSDMLFVPGGQSIELLYKGRAYNVKIGLHNAYLEVLYYMGLVPGGMLCLYIVLLCWDCLKALGEKMPADIEIMAFAVLITAIVGGFSGQYFIHQEGGTWFYLPAGIVSGYYLRHRAERMGPSVLSRFSAAAGWR